MKLHKITAVLSAFALCTALSACSSDRGNSDTASSSAEETTTVAASETAAAEQTTLSETTTTTALTTTAAEITAAPAQSSAAIQTNTSSQDNDTKLLASERGLEAVPKDSEDGYGEELKAGEDYLGWKLKSFDGILGANAEQVSELYADFVYNNGTLSVNGIVTVLPDDNPEYPGYLYLRVDNQADFPYFPADTRERGKFVIENTPDVLSMLGLSTTPDSDLAVSVTVSSLHVHFASNGYDTIRVTAASKR